MQRSLPDVVKEFYRAESPAHDYLHLVRVHCLALAICPPEKKASTEVIVAASYLHDLHRHLQQVRGHPVQASETDELARDLLRRAGISRALDDAILEAIHYTDRYSFALGGLGSARIEAMAVRDADNLDAIGAVGIARTFAYGGKFDTPIWDPTTEVKDEPYILGTTPPSTIHHFHEKLLRLRDDFELEAARKMAEDRHRMMELFLEQFAKEMRQAEC